MVESLQMKWLYMKFVHGRARHPQSQGSVERSNSDIKKMLAGWMRDNKTTKWATGLKFLQLRKNHSMHTGNTVFQGNFWS